MERSNNGIHQRPLAPGNSITSSNKGKYVAPGPGQNHRPGYNHLAPGNKAHVSTASVRNLTGNPSTSYPNRPPLQGHPTPMDTDLDDDRPLKFRSIKSPTTNLQSKYDLKNGMLPSKANPRNPGAVLPPKVNPVMARPNAIQNRSSLAATKDFSSDDSSDDDKPLASRIPIRHPPKATLNHNAQRQDDSDDDHRPLVVKRIQNGQSKVSTTNKLPSAGDSNCKKRHLDDNSKNNTPVKKMKLSNSLQSTTHKQPFHDQPTSTKLNSNAQSLRRPLTHDSPGVLSKPSRSPSPGVPSTGIKSKSSSSPLSVNQKPSMLYSSSSSHLQAKRSSSPSVSQPKPSSFPSGISTPSGSVSISKQSSIPSKSPSLTEKSSSLSAEQFKCSSTSKALTNTAVKMDIDDEDDDDDVPLAQRITVAKVVKKPTIAKQNSGSYSSVAAKKVIEARRIKLNQQKKLSMKNKIYNKNAPGTGGGQKWSTLEHNGVIFPPPYQPHGVKMLYNGKPVKLTPEQEEVATMFAVMRETDYVKKPKFLSNFWADWKKLLGPDHIIQNLDGCDFTPIYQWHLGEKEKKKLLPAYEKKRLKEEKQKQEEKYMWALVDGVKEKVGNFRVEPPGLFRGRGEHPKMGKLKRRIFPEDIVINIGKDAPVPECPMPGHRWKEIRHDNSVTWLAYWVDPVNPREFKYVFLAASSSLKGQSDREKYEKARTLKEYIEDIRKTYTKNFTSSDMTKKQIAVATYLIDRLALRAGNEKDDDEADTVGCCSLKVEHVTLVPPKSLQFDFLGKDSIRYFNVVEVLEPVYKAVGEFKKSKKPGEDLFDKLDTSKLNAHLKNIMPQLTAKVFRTYNASITLDKLLVDTDGHTIPEKIAAYQAANKEVAILCNHQRSVSKSHEAQMEKLESKMGELEELLRELRVDLDRAIKGKPPLKDADGKPKRNQSPEALKKKIGQTEQKIEKMKLDMRIKDDLKTVALGTSKINYMDPRITVAWCKRHEVPIEKIFNKSLLAKFAWAMDVDMDYRF